MPISPARRITFDVLHRVESEGAYAGDLLHALLDATVKPSDAALSTELTFGVLRFRRLLDFLLARHLNDPLDSLDPPVSAALRMGLYQLRFLERIPAHAAVDESVELVKRARLSSAAGLVNAVLRRCAQESRVASEKFIEPNVPPAERLGILHSHPTWMVERWLARFGESRTLALLEADNRPSRLSCVLSEERFRDQAFASLVRSGLTVEPGLLMNSAFAVSGGSPARTRAFNEGFFSIQDEASQAIPLLLAAQPGDYILDLCAAPGGKTPPLFRAVGASGLVVAADRHAHRLRALRAQFRRLGIDRIPILELDAAKPLPFAVRFDRILVDAPCSGSGTLARHPEIRWRLHPERLHELHALQVAMLVQALQHLVPSGRLLYSTCSLEAEENEDVVEEALRLFPAARRASPGEPKTALSPHLAPGVSASALFDPFGQFRTFPGLQTTDGFFAALLQLS
jgi:16S rRNA (cytosine967-C5)-methyltransferase